MEGALRSAIPLDPGCAALIQATNIEGALRSTIHLDPGCAALIQATNIDGTLRSTIHLDPGCAALIQATNIDVSLRFIERGADDRYIHIDQIFFQLGDMAQLRFIFARDEQGAAGHGCNGQRVRRSTRAMRID